MDLSLPNQSSDHIYASYERGKDTAVDGNHYHRAYETSPAKQNNGVGELYENLQGGAFIVSANDISRCAENSEDIDSQFQVRFNWLVPKIL